MATKDISRLLLQTKKHAVAARLQQGRVLLDSDLNEGAALGEEDRRRTLLHALGPKGSPDQGFTIRQPLDIAAGTSDVIHKGDVLVSEPVQFDDATTKTNVLPIALRAGSMYVGGLRFDLDDPEPIAFQRDFLQMTEAEAPTLESGQALGQLYYLNGWEQVVTPVEDEELVEAMLGGADTSVRVRRMRRVQVFPTTAATCNDAWVDLEQNVLNSATATFDRTTGELRSNGKLQLTFSGGESSDNCAPSDPLGKRYLGSENQTLRIMLSTNLSYVWALDDATPLFKVAVHHLDTGTGVTVEILNPPTDERNWPFKNRVVEIIPFGALLDGGELPGAGPHFRKIADELGVFTRASDTYDPTTRTFPIETTEGGVLARLQSLIHTWPTQHPDHDFLAEATDPNDPSARFFYMRMWHDAPTADDVQISTQKPSAPLGDTGIVPVFKADGQAGDFWVATLRTDAPLQVQPFDLLADAGVPPHGPRHFFAPLALLQGNAATGTPPQSTVTQLRDCRPRLRPLTERCATLTVGDGVHSFGDFTNIADALTALPPEGGVISVRPGVYPPVQIVRNHVTIEGCGEATVLQSENGGTAGVISVAASIDVRISSLRINAADESGLSLDESTGVAIDSLHIVSGTLGGGLFSPGGTLTQPQVDVALCDGVTLSGLTLEPNRQIGLHVADAQNVAVSDLSITGTSGSDDGLAQGLVHIENATTVSVTRASLTAVGQVAVRVTGANTADVELSHLTILAQERTTPLTNTTNLYSAVHMELGSRMHLRRSEITMENAPSKHAAVLVQGTTVSVEDCHVLCEGDSVSDVWGGIQVRGISTDVRVERNHVQNGYGHGITLGSLVWRSQVELEEPRAGVEGAGQGQTSGDSGSFVADGRISVFFETQDELGADDEGIIAGLVVTDNRIEGMATNGISALTVMGIRDSAEIMEFDDVRIERNVITGNLLRVNDNIDDVATIPFPTSREGTSLSLSMLPFGGIVLPTVINGDLRENVIVDNGTALDVLPVNGIFVLTGDSLTVENNRIAGNGKRAPDDNTILVHPGVRAGVAVMLAGIGAMHSSQDISDTLVAHTTLEGGGIAVRISGNSVEQPEGRALHVVGSGPFQINGNFLASLGNHGGDDVTEQFEVGELIYIQNLGAPFESLEFNKIPINVEFTQPNLASNVLTDKLALSPRLYVGAGGQVQFNNNQTVLDWQVARQPTQGAPLSFFPIAILSLDHTGMLGNQLAMRVEGDVENIPQPIPPMPSGDAAVLEALVFEPVFCHLFAIGVTTSIQFNRFSENVGGTFLSIMSNADTLQNTSYNQCTHDVFVIRTPRDTGFLVTSPNQIVFARIPGASDANGGVAEANRQFMVDFMTLVIDPSRPIPNN
jgi:hypothetical protein